MVYMGSKSRIAKYIVPIIQKEINENEISIYIEPFVGGANVIDKIECQNKIGSDIDKYLIALLKYVQMGGILPDRITREEYNVVRDTWRKDDTYEFEDWYVGCACYLASYSGRDFSGGYSPAGWKKSGVYRDYYQESMRNLISQAALPKYKDIDFRVCDYRNLQPKGCLIYADPPYKKTKKFSNSKNFNHEEFWEIMREWSEHNIVLISELEAPDDFNCIWQKDTDRSLKAAEHKRAVEKLFLRST